MVFLSGAGSFLSNIGNVESTSESQNIELEGTHKDPLNPLWKLK